LFNNICPSWLRSHRPRARSSSKRNRNSLHERWCFVRNIGADGVFKFLKLGSWRNHNSSKHFESHRLVLKEPRRTANKFLASQTQTHHACSVFAKGQSSIGGRLRIVFVDPLRNSRLPTRPKLLCILQSN